MWSSANVANTRDRVCYIFHHWAGQNVDRSEIVVTTASGTTVPREEYDDPGLSAWFLFRSVPQRLCSQAGHCTRCKYALGEVARSDRGSDAVVGPAHVAYGDFRIPA